MTKNTNEIDTDRQEEATVMTRIDDKTLNDDADFILYYIHQLKQPKYK